jgi:hypothetical protein
MMGPQSEGRPSGDGRGYGGQAHAEDGRRYQSDREVGMQDRFQQGRDLATQDRYQSDRDIDMQDASLPMPGAFAPDTRLTASPSGSASGRDREGDPKTSGERNRSRTRNGRTASGQLRMCKKCGEPLTGQFVRALGGTFHLDCFKCRVCILTMFAHVVYSLTVWLYRIAGK